VTPAEQYRAATEGAAMFDVSDRALIEVTGRDRATFLHSFCTNDIKKLQPGGRGCEAFVTNVKGRILGHILVFAEKHHLTIDSDPGTQGALLAHLERYVITEDVQIRDISSQHGRLFVCGPAAGDALGEPLAIRTGDVPMFGPVMTDASAWRVPFAVSRGWLAAVGGMKAWEIAHLKDLKVAEGDRDVLEVLRIEAMWPRYGVDITEEHLAQEAGRTSQAISFTKGCYLGQEPIARLDALGHTNRELRGIRCTAPGKVSAGAVVLDAGGAAEVGRVSSAAVNPVTSCAVALAMVKTVANKPGTAVRVRSEGGEEIDGVVYASPAVD